MNKRTFVLGIDGVPYSLLKGLFETGRMGSLHEICNRGSYRRMNSVHPTISSVAWTTYSTGVNPAEHSIFGFVDRKPNPFSVYIPLSHDRKVDSLWQYLSKKGKRVIVINVPLSFPPEPVNGIIASGFLCTGMDKLCYPEKYNQFFSSKGYVIDVDAWKARDDKRGFMDDLFEAMEKRFEVAFELMDVEEWDFFQLHIMETDRLLHFFWADLENGGEFRDDVYRFFDLLDTYIGRLRELLTEEDSIMVLSDHGFCSVKSEVELNVWLEKEQLLKIEDGAERKLLNLHRDSVCYSLIPGRIYINLEGREEMGSVKKADYDQTREMIREKLTGMRHPDTNEKVIDRVFFREEVYSGSCIENAADIIAHPVDGYDLKGRVDKDMVFERSALNGMHTYYDAFICSDRMNVSDIQSIEEVRSTVTDHVL
jgi:predicted AlkP superfamily phosphohydrolase/phosphomutase